jgi:MoaA/NifB/PqqE/SkfB family radical SAM enzyme
MNELQFKRPEKFEVELTSKCVLACPRCARTMDDEQLSNTWKFGQLDPTVIEKLAQMPSLRMFNFTGSYGDPIYHTQLFDIIKIAKKYGKKVDITTAGSHRSKEWWMELITLLEGKDFFTFSVDGLRHNNHIYRINSDWNSIETGMRIVAKAPINTIWKWILFKYNENDALEGYKLSQDIGIKNFQIVETDRWPEGQQATRSINDVIAEIEAYRNSQK